MRNLPCQEVRLRFANLTYWASGDHTVFPLPPLPGQGRIIAGVDKSMMLCDRLEKSLAARDDTRGSLSVDLLNEALGQDETGAGRQRVIPRYSLESGIQPLFGKRLG